MVMEYNQYKKYITILATKFVIFIYWLHYISKLIRYVFFQLFPSVPFCHLELTILISTALDYYITHAHTNVALFFPFSVS